MQDTTLAAKLHFVAPIRENRCKHTHQLNMDCFFPIPPSVHTLCLDPRRHVLLDPFPHAFYNDNILMPHFNHIIKGVPKVVTLFKENGLLKGRFHKED
jgi:hypothetical protein